MKRVGMLVAGGAIGFIAGFGVGVYCVRSSKSGKRPSPPVSELRRSNVVEPYPGFAEDCALLRKTYWIDRPWLNASSAEACQAAIRIFRRASFIGITREEVLDLLGDPATISDYGQPVTEGPNSTLVYRFDSGLGGWQYTIGFEADRVRSVQADSLE